jgi:hypothetical protein
MVAPVLTELKTDHRKDPSYRPYQPFGSAERVLYNHDPEILMCGPAGTGKSRAILEKMHLCASKYPGMRGLMIRKTRESLTQSAMVTYDKFVVPQNGGVHFRTSEQEYRYQNGSTVVLGGMDKASKVLSSEYDLIYVQQAEELTEEDWETLTTRCRLGIMPYNQTIGDCNPNAAKHWLKRKADANLLTYIKSVHEDNPVLYDHEAKRWTKRGADYIGKLQRLSGVRRKRLYEGVWCSAEGMIFDEWDSTIHLINHFNPPSDWVRIWVVDFGYVAPFVWQAWALNEETDTAYMFAEIYCTKLLAEDVAAQIRTWRTAAHEPFPTALVCDHDAEDRATLERHLGIDTEPADKAVSAGLQSVKTRLRPREDTGKPGLFIMRDSLLEVDSELDEMGKPIQTVDEIEGYEWNDPKRKDREGPRQVDDHGMDTMRYLCKYLEGEFGGWSQGMG